VLCRRKCEDRKKCGFLLLQNYESTSVHIVRCIGESLHETSKWYRVSLVLWSISTRNSLFLARIVYSQIDVGVISCRIN
jgi:hypothetical protein